MSLIQALLIASVYYLVNSPWPCGGLGNYATVYRPMVSGLIVGIILGDPVKGTQIGATINLIYIGFISAGGAMPADMSLAGVLGTALAIAGGLDIDAALAVAVPLGLLGSLVWVGHLTLDTFLVRISDKYVEDGKPEKVWIVNILFAQLILFAMTAIPCFLAAFYGVSYISGIIANLSGTFLTILATIGGMLPAVGIGMMLMSIFKGQAKIYFFLGFLIAAYLGLSTLQLGLIFLCVALLVSNFKKEDFATAENGIESKNVHLLDFKDVRKAWWNWMYYFQSCYNYERMQGVGFLHAMTPIIKKLYKNDLEETKSAMRRSSEFFNTENATGSCVIGLVAAMEEQKAGGAKIDDEAFTSIKTGLMGPLAGVGDTLWQSVMIPMMLILFIGLAKDGSVIAPVLYCVSFYAVYYGFGYWLLKLGYNKGSEAILSLMESGVINKVINAASILGLAVLGGLVSSYVSLKLAVTFSSSADAVISIQTNFLDAILPGLLPLLLTLGCYKLAKKGVKPYVIMLGIVALAVVGGLTGIL